MRCDNGFFMTSGKHCFELKIKKKYKKIPRSLLSVNYIEYSNGSHNFINHCKLLSV